MELCGKYNNSPILNDKLSFSFITGYVSSWHMAVTKSYSQIWITACDPNVSKQMSAFSNVNSSTIVNKISECVITKHIQATSIETW